jgi:hypothetical protein
MSAIHAYVRPNPAQSCVCLAPQLCGCAVCDPRVAAEWEVQRDVLRLARDRLPTLEYASKVQAADVARAMHSECRHPLLCCCVQRAAGACRLQFSHGIARVAIAPVTVYICRCVQPCACKCCYMASVGG